jgi:hypothetical protein
MEFEPQLWYKRGLNDLATSENKIEIMGLWLT